MPDTQMTPGAPEPAAPAADVVVIGWTADQLIAAWERYAEACNVEPNVAHLRNFFEAGYMVGHTAAQAEAPAPAAPPAGQPGEAVPGDTQENEALHQARTAVLVQWSRDIDSPQVWQTEGAGNRARSLLEALEDAVRAEPPREEGGRALEAARRRYDYRQKKVGTEAFIHPDIRSSKRLKLEAEVEEAFTALVAAARAPGPDSSGD